MRSKASDFDYSEISDLYNKWTKYFNINEQNSGLTYKSILYCGFVVPIPKFPDVFIIKLGVDEPLAPLVFKIRD